MKKNSLFKNLIRVWKHLSIERKMQIPLLFSMMILVSFAEVISIGAVLPFLGVIAAPENIFVHDLAQPLINLLGIQTPRELLLPFTLIFITAAILVSITRTSLLWIQTHLSRAIGADLSVQVYRLTLYQPYNLQISRNSSEIMAGVVKASSLVGTIIQPIMIMASSLLILLAVIVTLLAIQPVIALGAFLGFGLIYVAIVSVTKRRIARNSETIATQQIGVTKAIQEGLGGIRDVLLDGTQSFYTKLYKDALLPMQAANASNQVVSASPRYGVEALGIVLIAGLAYMLSAGSVTSGRADVVIPILGALALGAQRLFPLLQQIYSSYISLKGNQASTQDALDLLDQPMPSYIQLSPAKPMVFQNAITLKDLCFRYTPEAPWIIRNLNLEISKGTRVGFVGVTGSGKSTLLDLVMGLLTPTKGELLIDNVAVNSQNTRAWQAHISHVPQAIYLSDSSIVENIAFGVQRDLIDMQRVKEAARRAQIDQNIENWPNRYDTLVGERGLRLSGGQRQRIGIARALYRRANVIVFDEATSALDNETETSVMEAVETLDQEVTILIIAHRITTLKNCDRIVKIAGGGIEAIGDYKQIIGLA